MTDDPAAPVRRLRPRAGGYVRPAAFGARRRRRGGDPVRNAALAFLAAGSCVLLLGAVWPHPATEVASLVTVAAFPVALMALGASRKGALGPLRLPLGVLLVLLEAGMLAMLSLRGSVAEAVWLGGLPLATAIQLYGIGLLPLPLVCLAYALSFDSFGLSRRELEDLRSRFERHRPPES